MKLARYFSDHMILQREQPFFVWGFEGKGAITGELRRGDEILRAAAVAGVDGAFCLEFAAVEGGYEYCTLRVSCGDECIEVRNIRFGDVYLTMGQSNMSYPLSATEGLEEYRLRASSSDAVCFLNLPEADITPEGYVNRPAKPQPDLCGDYSWQKISDPEAVQVSAISFIFAIEMSELVKVPIAFVHTAMGGVSIDTYLPRWSIARDPVVGEFLGACGKLIREEEYNTFGGGNYTQLAGLFHEKICPLEKVRFKGAIWHQGENSACTFESAVYYEHALRLLFASYREFFSQPELPFICVQIAPELYPYGDTFGYLYINEAIERACSQTPNTWCIPIYDVEPRWLRPDGETYYHPIHPCNKNALGKRCAELFDRNLCRGDSFSYPRIVSTEEQDGELLLHVDTCGQPLDSVPELYGFSVAEEDGKYYAACARLIAPDVVAVSSRFLSRPKYATYAFFQYNTVCNLRTADGHPVLPFRSVREPVNASYYLTPLFAGCEFASVMESNFGYEVGGGMRVPLWKGGSLLGSPVQISFSSDRAEGQLALRVEYHADPAGYYYFGAEPKIDLCGQPNHLDRFHYLTLKLKAESELPVEFHGALFRRPGGLYKFRPLCGGEPVVQTHVHSDYRDYTVDLRECQSGDEGVLSITPQQKAEIYAFELYFRCKSDAVVYLDDLQFHDSPPSDSEIPEQAENTVLPAEMRLPS